MVNWELANDDAYYRGRRIEERARKEGSAGAWQEFADLKAKKGSYVLAVHGYLNSASICEQQGDSARAFDLLGRAFECARRAKSNDLALIAAYRQALVAERTAQWEACIGIYEAAGVFCEESGSHFLAADAYEHAAEIMKRSGRDPAAYTKPVELWRRNAAYWRDRGHEEDARWSENHVKLYQNLFAGGRE